MIRLLPILLVLVVTGCASQFVQEYWAAVSARTGVSEPELQRIAAAAEQKHKMAVTGIFRASDGVLLLTLADRKTRSHETRVQWRQIDGIWKEDPTAGSVALVAAEFECWRERVKRVRVGMPREEVERLLPVYRTSSPALSHYSVRHTTRTGGAQADSYYVGPGYLVVVFYDYTGQIRDPGSAVSRESPQNRVIEPVTLSYRPLAPEMPNKAPEPTTMSVTSPAEQETRRP